MPHTLNIEITRAAHCSYELELEEVPKGDPKHEAAVTVGGYSFAVVKGGGRAERYLKSHVSPAEALVTTRGSARFVDLTELAEDLWYDDPDVTRIKVADERDCVVLELNTDVPLAEALHLFSKTEDHLDFDTMVQMRLIEKGLSAEEEVYQELYSLAGRIHKMNESEYSQFITEAAGLFKDLLTEEEVADFVALQAELDRMDPELRDKLLEGDLDLLSFEETRAAEKILKSDPRLKSAFLRLKGTYNAFAQYRGDTSAKRVGHFGAKFLLGVATGPVVALYTVGRGGYMMRNAKGRSAIVAGIQKELAGGLVQAGSAVTGASITNALITQNPLALPAFIIGLTMLGAGVTVDTVNSVRKALETARTNNLKKGPVIRKALKKKYGRELKLAAGGLATGAIWGATFGAVSNTLSTGGASVKVATLGDVGVATGWAGGIQDVSSGIVGTAADRAELEGEARPARSKKKTRSEKDTSINVPKGRSKGRRSARTSPQSNRRRR